MKLEPHEHELVGKWIADSSGVHADEVTERIQHLVENVLKQVAFSKEAGAWETLFIDPSDGRLWEQIYPKSWMHGGGPPALREIAREEAMKKYGTIGD